QPRHPDGRSRRLQAGPRPGLPLAPLVLKPSSPAHGGAAVARDDGKVWLVNYALPGEVVEAEPRGRQGGVAVAAATRVIEASPHRVAAPCPYFGACGGCQLPHASYAHQLELERAAGEGAFAQAANELQLTGLQNLLLTAEPTGSGLLWRLRFHGREPRWPRDDFAHRVAELLPGSTLLDEAMTLEFWNMTFRVRSDTFLQT